MSGAETRCFFCCKNPNKSKSGQDGLPATALGFNPPDEGVMSEAPRRKDDGLISGWALFRDLAVKKASHGKRVTFVRLVRVQWCYGILFGMHLYCVALIILSCHLGYLMIGLYVGLATVGVFIYWFTSDDSGHTLVSLDQLMNWGQCSSWGGFAAEPLMNMDFSSDPCDLAEEFVVDVGDDPGIYLKDGIKLS